jgi:divinyl chlorophyllide a 8-vinyl-reductase
LLGATGTIGRATAIQLARRGHDVVCFVRPRSSVDGPFAASDIRQQFASVTIKEVEIADPGAIARDGFGDVPFDAIVSCMTSHTGIPKDAWAIDYRAHLNVLEAAKRAGVRHFVLLSAICVQKPLLAFQNAKLAFEAALIDSGLRSRSCGRRPSLSLYRAKSSAYGKGNRSWFSEMVRSPRANPSAMETWPDT